MADYTNNTVEAMVAEDGLIDKMELEVSFFNATELAFLAEYQTLLASANSSVQQDNYFLLLLKRLLTELGAGRSGQTA